MLTRWIVSGKILSVQGISPGLKGGYTMVEQLMFCVFVWGLPTLIIVGLTYDMFFHKN